MVSKMKTIRILGACSRTCIPSALLAGSVLLSACASAPPPAAPLDDHRSAAIAVEGTPIQLHAERDTVSAELFLVAALDDSVAPGSTMRLKANFIAPLGLSSAGGYGVIRYPLSFTDRREIQRFPGKVSLELETVSARLGGSVSSRDWDTVTQFLGQPWIPAGGGPATIAASSGPSAEGFAGLLGVAAGILGFLATNSQISDAEDLAHQLGTPDPDFGNLETQRVAWALIGAAGIVLMVSGF